MNGETHVTDWSSPPNQVPEQLLGYRRDPRWRDMSDYLVHFTHTSDELGAILSQGCIESAGPFGWGKNISELTQEHKSACLSEVPVDMVDRLISRHGHFGIGFRRDFVTSLGGARVWYLDDCSPVSSALFESVRQLLRRQDFNDDLWKLTPFIDRIIPGRYEFEWEREWRVPGGLHFQLSDVAFAIVPGEGGREFVTSLGLSAPIIRADDREAWWLALPQALGDAVDTMVARFLTEYNDPVDHLPWDSESGYIWIVEEWETSDAIHNVFEHVEPSVYDQLKEYLDNISTSWVRVSDFKDFYS